MGGECVGGDGGGLLGDGCGIHHRAEEMDNSVRANVTVAEIQFSGDTWGIVEVLVEAT